MFNEPHSLYDQICSHFINTHVIRAKIAAMAPVSVYVSLSPLCPSLDRTSLPWLLHTHTYARARTHTHSLILALSVLSFLFSHFLVHTTSLFLSFLISFHLYTHIPPRVSFSPSFFHSFYVSFFAPSDFQSHTWSCLRGSGLQMKLNLSSSAASFSRLH